MFQCSNLMRATSQLLYLLWFRPFMLVFTQDEISLSKYCMMFSLQPSNASSSLWNNEMMISPVVLQYPVEYKSSPNPFNVSKKALLKKAGRISKWQAEELLYYSSLDVYCSVNTGILSLQQASCPPFWDSACHFEKVTKLAPPSGKNGPFWG